MLFLIPHIDNSEFQLFIFRSNFDGVSAKDEVDIAFLASKAYFENYSRVLSL